MTPRSPGAGRQAPVRAGWLSILVAAAILSGLWSFSWNKSLIGDEALTIAIAEGPYPLLIEQVGIESHVPGYYTLMWAWIRVFGPGLPSLRLFALIPALALLVVTGRLLSRDMMALLCASPFLLDLSVELRMYGLLALAGALFLAALRAVDASTGRRPLAFLVILSILAVWIHHFAWPGVAASLAVLARRRRFRDCAILSVCVLAFYAPWMPKVLQQLGRFGPGALETDLVGHATLGQTLAGFPLSVAGTLLRFSSGTAAFSFGLFSIRDLSPWAAPGLLLFAVMLAAAARGARRAGLPAVLVLLAVMIPLGFMRPSARHFSLAFPAFVMLASRGFEGIRRIRPGVPAASAIVLSAALCVPFAARSTLPQRCTFDRDLMEAALTAGGTAELEGVPIVVYLDNYTSLAFLYHLRDEGFGEVMTWHPHEAMFAGGWLIYPDPVDAMGYLLHDTDSLFCSIMETAGDRFVLVANDPTVVGGPPFGTGDRLLGRGSDMISDEDLIDVLSERHGLDLSRIELRRSEGPLSIFLVSDGAGGWLGRTE